MDDDFHPTLAACANNARAWTAALMVQEIDLRTNAHLKVAHEGQEYADNPSLEEAADVFISLFVSMAHHGWTNADLANAVWDKMAVNRERTWYKKADGTYQHD
jgi:hypothetical protein